MRRLNMTFSRWPGRTTEESIIIKLNRYLLNPEHVNAKGFLSGKALWFRGVLGFTRYNASELVKQIRFNKLQTQLGESTEDGQMYYQPIRIVGANGRVKTIVFTWIENIDGIVRLVSIKKFPKYRGKKDV